MSTVPGAFDWDDPMFDDGDTTDDPDYDPAGLTESEDADMRELEMMAAAAQAGSEAAGQEVAFVDDEDDEGTNEDDDDDDEGTEAAGDDDDGFRLGIDQATGQVVLINQAGTQTPLGANTVGGLTGAQFLSALFGQGRDGLRPRRSRMMAMLQDDDEDEEEEEEDDEDDDDIEVDWMGRRRPRRPNRNWYPVTKSPEPKGVELLRSGDFGRTPRHLAHPARKWSRSPHGLHDTFRLSESSLLPSTTGSGLSRSPPSSQTQAGLDYGAAGVPNSDGTEVATYSSRIYSGRYSDDGEFFYTCSQAYKVYIYDMTKPPKVRGTKTVSDTTMPDPAEEPALPGWPRFGLRSEQVRARSSLHLSRTFQARERDCRWTITDAALSPDNNFLIYSSITPLVHMVKTRGQDAVLGLGLEDHEQERFDFSERMGFGIWSLRFSSDGRQIAAGCSEGIISVFDIETRRPVMSIRGHEDDTNAVCFADQLDPNIIVSGSDDSLIKIWDRRALRSSVPSGVLVGHTEGITYVEGKGDGRYVLSNGKDQGAKLWDLRVMQGHSDYARERRVDAGIPGWDYRQGFYQKPRYTKHPQDRSVITYRGHAVLQTLIRAHISPVTTTGQQYIYSGSADGKIHIWHLDGRIAQVLDRSKTRPLLSDLDGGYNDPMAPFSKAEMARAQQRNGRELDRATVRDVSWDPRTPSLVSTCWGGTGGAQGSLAMHHWLSYGKRGEAIEPAADAS